MTRYNTHGSELRVGDGESTETFTQIAQLAMTNLPALSLQEFNVTSHEDGSTRRLPGKVLDGGPVRGEVFFDPDDPTHDESTGVLALIAGKDLHNFQVATPSDSGLRYAFSGFLKQVGEVALGVDGEMRMPIEIAIDGDVTIEADA